MTIPDDKLPVLPEPVGHQIICYGRYQSFVVRADVADEVACKLREQSDPEADFRAVFTADQLRTAQREAIEAVMPKWIPVKERMPPDGELVFTAQRRNSSKTGLSYSIGSWSEYNDSMICAAQFRSGADFWLPIPPKD